MTASPLDRVLAATTPLLSRAVHRLLVEVASRIRIGQLEVRFPDGSARVFGQPDAAERAVLVLHDDRAMRRILLGGETGAGEAYMDGLWSSPDLPALLRLAGRNRAALGLSSGWLSVPQRAQLAIAHRMRHNSPANARRNIAAHYDLGNDFYRLWLDETLTYSSAVFETEDQSLEDAQRAKYRRLAEGAALRAGDEVLEIGSGWGGFALYAAGELGCHVTSITLSAEQQRLATERVRAAGLQDRVTIELRDYRDVRGTYDAIVSIEMLEAVGADYLDTYFQASAEALRPGGRVSLQSITVPEAPNRRRGGGTNWIQTYIFPGGHLPSLGEIGRALRGTGLVVSAVRDIAPHYVRTLQAWRAAFHARRPEVLALGFDETFIRMWDFYLALSEAGFANGITQDLQIVLEQR